MNLRLLTPILATSLLGCSAAPRSAFDPVVMERRLACVSSETNSDSSMPELPPDVRADPVLDPSGFALETTPATPEPGRPSDLMARATQLYDDDDFKGAVPVLQRVIRNEGQDDAGNLELAEYRLGVSYYRSGLFQLAIDVFKPIARNRAHLMHHETLYWLVDLALEQETNLLAIDLAYLYVGENYFDLDSTNRELLYLIQYIWGRGYYRAGIYPEAIRKMEAVMRDPRFSRIASDCASTARQAWGRPID
jgi:tetratricopeptide (TPR) repeat protein